MYDNAPTQEIEIDTDSGSLLNIYDAGSTTIIEVWSGNSIVMKDEIRLTKSQAKLLIRALQEAE